MPSAMENGAGSVKRPTPWDFDFLSPTLRLSDHSKGLLKMFDNKRVMDLLDRLDLDDEDRQLLESAIEEPQKQLLQVIDELPAGYTEVDLKGKILSVNKATLDMTLRTKDELINLPFEAYTESETANEVYQAYHQVYQTGISRKGFIQEVVRKDGKPIIIENAISLKKVNGKAVGFRGIWNDISERIKNQKDLADHRSRLEAIFRSVKDGIIAVNAEGRVTDINHAVASICAVPIENTLENRYVETQTLCSRTCHALLQDTLSKKAEIKDYQIHCDRHDRPHQVISFNSSPLIDGNGQYMGAVLVLRDITELLGLERELRDRYKFQNLVGKSKKMREIYDLCENLASVETTVLITGQSGTGKELVAKALHYVGQRAKKPFVKVNCSALTESLLESEMFGHVKGAFTGAVKDRQGRFQMANGGTILLDEIGDISPLIQLKLLRVLQEKEFECVGDSNTHKVDVRVIASTNKDLKKKVKEGEFREDLYYRLKVMEICLPPLNERLEDLPLLVAHFCETFNARFKKSIHGVSGDVLTRFMNYEWPGNVRELEHVLEHAFVICTGTVIMMEHLPAEIITLSKPETPADQNPKTLNIYDAQDILKALKQTHWNKTEAAKLLGVHRRTIHRKIAQHKLSPFN